MTMHVGLGKYAANTIAAYLMISLASNILFFNFFHFFSLKFSLLVFHQFYYSYIIYIVIY